MIKKEGQVWFAKSESLNHFYIKFFISFFLIDGTTLVKSTRFGRDLFNSKPTNQIWKSNGEKNFTTAKKCW